MPRFFFHYIDDQGRTPDDVGQEFADAETAIHEARLAVQDALADAAFDPLSPGHSGSYMVTDDQGQLVIIIPFASLMVVDLDEVATVA